ncbi:MAG TPA: class I SAM-dependent methyltransferase [Acidiferrobacter sp.]|nr:class I SAM-dependent methyltransferase [Acidiferrobacter sp.]
MSHDQHVTDQFDRTAERYRTSAVHAQGSDLATLRAVAERLHPAAALDVGCGPGHASFAMAPFCERVHAVDASGEMLRVAADEARRRNLAQITIHRAPATDLPFPDASMDLVSCRYSAHHWRDVDAGLAEIVRVLKPDGVFVLTDSIGYEAPLADTHLQTIELLRDTSHVRSYRASEWVATLGCHGLVPWHCDFFRVRLAFDEWVERSQTPPGRVAVIRQLLADAPLEVRRAFAIADDGSLELDVLTCQARRVAYPS